MGQWWGHMSPPYTVSIPLDRLYTKYNTQAITRAQLCANSSTVPVITTKLQDCNHSISWSSAQNMQYALSRHLDTPYNRGVLLNLHSIHIHVLYRLCRLGYQHYLASCCYWWQLKCSAISGCESCHQFFYHLNLQKKASILCVQQCNVAYACTIESC